MALIVVLRRDQVALVNVDVLVLVGALQDGFAGEAVANNVVQLAVRQIQPVPFLASFTGVIREGVSEHVPPRLALRLIRHGENFVKQNG